MNKFYVDENNWIGVLNTGKIEEVSLDDSKVKGIYKTDTKHFRFLLSSLYKRLPKNVQSRFLATLTYREKDKYFIKLEGYEVNKFPE